MKKEIFELSLVASKTSSPHWLFFITCDSFGGQVVLILGAAVLDGTSGDLFWKVNYMFSDAPDNFFQQFIIQYNQHDELCTRQCNVVEPKNLSR